MDDHERLSVKEVPVGKHSAARSEQLAFVCESNLLSPAATADELLDDVRKVMRIYEDALDARSEKQI